jgi:hypothetical protein
VQRDRARRAVRIARVALPLMAAAAARSACAADVSSYFDSAAGRKPHGNAGLVVNGGWMQLKADVALRAQSGSTAVVPNLRSVFDVGNRLDVETRVDLADRNDSGGALGATMNTRVHYDPPPKFLEAVEGVVWKAPDGEAGEKLNIAFKKVVGAAERERPITIRGRAAVETTTIPVAGSVGGVSPADESHRYGFETEIRGLLSGLVRGSGALRLTVERFAGARVETVRSLAYDYSWTVRNFAHLGLNVGMRRDTRPALVVSEPSLGLTWRAQF